MCLKMNAEKRGNENRRLLAEQIAIKSSYIIENLNKFYNFSFLIRVKMKTIAKVLLPAFTLLSGLFLYSCEKSNQGSDETGLAEFSVEMTVTALSESAKGADSVITAMQIMVSVEDYGGNKIFTDKLIPLYSFGTGLLSENLELPSGDYKLTKFLVINTEGKVLYAAPLAGSSMAYLVKNPLPLKFHIEAGQVTRLSPELLEVTGTTPDKFGYLSFAMQVVNPVECWTYCVIDNPLSAAPILITSAKVTVVTPDGWRYTYPLAEKINKIVIRGGSEIYAFLVEKEGYLPHKYQFTAAQIKASSQENPLVLKIPFNSQFRTIVLQPGPERGKDAMVSNLDPDKNFGGHKYFETTFLTEPVLTVMRSNRSLIYFNTDTIPEKALIRRVILTLSYDIPIPFDNSFSYLVGTLPGPGIAWFGAAFQKITEPWEENNVNWNTQPKTTETGQVFLSPFIKNANMIDVDVSRLFISSKDFPDPNYGIMFRLWPADRFPGFRFASSDYQVASMRPKLTIYYSLN